MSDVILAGRYRLGPLVGAGGMGAVYRADDLERGSEVAVKMMRPDCSDAAMARRYLRAEGRFSARIAHPNVVTMLAAGTTESRDPYVVMELVSGRSLRAVLHEQGPFSIRRASAIVQQVLAGLDAIHAAGFAHGDVKADNVLVDADDRATLIDFGLMRARTDRKRRDDGFACGTPEYMAPELARGESPSVASDIYAVGVLLYELVTGSTPFAGGSSIEVLCRQLEDELVPAGLRCPERVIPNSIEHVIARALEKAASARFDDAADFASALATATPASDGQLAAVPSLGANTDTVRWRRRLAAGTRPPKSRR